PFSSGEGIVVGVGVPACAPTRAGSSRAPHRARRSARFMARVSTVGRTGGQGDGACAWSPTRSRGTMRRRMQEPPPTWLRRGLPLLVAGLTAAAFLPSLQNDFVLWDDDLNLTGNRRYRGLSAAHLRWMFTTLHGGHYQPLSWLTLGVDHALWGMNASGYHLTSLLLHTVTALVVYAVLLALLSPAPTRSMHLAA